MHIYIKEKAFILEEGVFFDRNVVMMFVELFTTKVFVYLQKLTHSDSEQKLSAIMDSVVKFRSDVRQFALNPELPEITPGVYYMCSAVDKWLIS